MNIIKLLKKEDGIITKDRKVMTEIKNFFFSEYVPSRPGSPSSRIVAAG
jgi:hypothetical protein